MNWDTLIGRARQATGRLLQAGGERFGDRRWILRGEAMEYAGRLQTRYGLLKHQVQWGAELTPIAIRNEPTLPAKKSLSL